MSFGIVLEFDKSVGKTQYDAVNEKLGIDMGNGSDAWPEGLRSHAGGTTADGFVVFEVWDSKAQQVAWIGGRLGAALAAVGVPAPVRVSEVELTGFETR
jgi:hypothetical protein